MAADDERAERIKTRIKALKEEDPTKTQKWIADQIPVSERSVAHWSATGEIGYPNCVKLAEVLDVDPTWLWRGPKGDTPDLMGTLGETTALDRIESKLDETLRLLRQLAGEQLPGPPDELLQLPAKPKPKRGTVRRVRKPPAAGSQ
jgi:hypothetical protein